MTNAYFQHLFKSPVGELTLIAHDKALCALLWKGDGETRAKFPKEIPRDPKHPILKKATEQLTEYFRGTRRTFDLPLEPMGTDFQTKVWKVLRTIPFGKRLAYSEQAARLGDRKKARAVGAANGKNPISIIVPCHRVVGKNGSLTGFGGGLGVKKFLLDFEAKNL